MAASAAAQGQGPPEAAAAAASAATKARAALLRVAIVQADGLRNADWGGKSDPYCVCSLRKAQGKPVEKFKTKVINDCLSPVWNHPAQTIADAEAGDVLEFKVMDKDPAKSDDFLGKAELPIAPLTPDGFSGKLSLQDAGKGINATLTVQIQV